MLEGNTGSSRTFVLWIAGGIGIVLIVAGWKGKSVMQVLSGHLAGVTAPETSTPQAQATGTPGIGIGGTSATGTPGKGITLPSTPTAPAPAPTGGVSHTGNVVYQDGVAYMLDDYGNPSAPLPGPYQTNPGNYIGTPGRGIG